MPERTLNKDSSDKEVSDWVQACLRLDYKEHPEKTAEQHQGKCFGMAEDQIGRPVKRGGK